ncbi:MAG: M13 family metallopeptidase [Muribaculaceae bacterium]
MRNLKYALLFIALTPTIFMNAKDVKKAGVDPANLDCTVAPGNDFFQYACGGWMKNNPLEGQYSRFGTFDQLGENNKTQVRELIQNLGKENNAKGSVAQKVDDLYKMGIDSVRLNKEGGNPIQEDLAKIANLNRKDLTKIIASQHNGIGAPFFGTFVMSDLKDANVNVLYMSQGGMSLGDRDYYLLNDDSSKKIRAEYLKYLQKVFSLSGYSASKAKKAATNIMKIETILAKVAMSREELRDYSKQYNARTVAELKKDYPNIDWNTYFTTIGLKDVDKMIVCQLNSMAKVNELMKTLSDQELKDYLSYSIISVASSYLSDDFYQAEFDMFSKTLSGKKDMEPRWKRALSVPNGLLGEAVGKLYVEKYFAGDSKAKMLKLVNNLKTSLGEHIANLTWMTEATKINALVKLNSFIVKVGYPDKWRDYSGITIDATQSYWTNIKKAIEFESAYQYNKYYQPVDKEEWGMTPQTVNAYYNPSTNEICFPAGILQAPFFDVNADDASNYGAIGVVIGHEMTHGFDDQGRNFDQNGNMVDWWKPSDAENFKKLTDVLVAQYDSIKVLGDVHANGTFTLGENIADHGGLRVSYTAFKKTLQGMKDIKTDGLTPDQRFYLAYANVWAANIRDEEILRRTKMDPHSLGKWRVNAALRNVQPFFDAFSIKAGDPMFLAPENRVTIW